MVDLIASMIVIIGFIIVIINKEKEWIGATMIGIGMFLICAVSFFNESFIMAIIALVLMFGNFIVAHYKYNEKTHKK